MSPDLDPITKDLLLIGVDRQYVGIIRAAIARTGVGAPGTKGDTSRLYAARLMAHYLGKGPTPIPPRELNTLELEHWAKRRAWDELERDAHRLPALRLELQPA